MMSNDDAERLGRDAQVILNAIFTHVDLQGFAADAVLEHFTCEDGSLDAERLLAAIRAPMLGMISGIAKGANVPRQTVIDDVKRRADRLALEGE